MLQRIVLGEENPPIPGGLIMYVVRTGYMPLAILGDYCVQYRPENDGTGVESHRIPPGVPGSTAKLTCLFPYNNRF